MEIRKGELKDIDEIMDIYSAARRFMRENGNPTQWAGEYPPRELIIRDIQEGICHVATDNDRLCGVFAFIFGNDPTYEIIENGVWLNNNPYAVIHRIASAGTTKGLLKTAIEYCISQASELRIDTHHDNKKMQYLLTKYGFARCGIIYLPNGEPRIAYQYAKKGAVKKAPLTTTSI